MTDVRDRLQRSIADRYRIEEEIGRGGMATVYLAQDLKHGRPVAVKVLPPELASTLGAERFAREIQLVARLQHPHVLSLHDSGGSGDILYYVMPYVAGESLRRRLEREGPLPVAEAVRIAGEVADALHYAHAQGVLHRDIKPENILLSNGHAVVADFGIARVMREAADGRLTGTGVSIGTPLYMSPEQVAGDAAVDGRSDVYSLGCVLYEMLAGAPPFTGPTTQAILVQHFVQPPPHARAVRPEVPDAVDAAIVHALAKDPAERFATGAALAEALARALTGPHAGASAPPPATGVPSARANTILVLDFTNLSRDPTLDWLCGGIAETVSVDLKKVAGLQVIGRDRLVRTLASRDGQAVGEDEMLSVACALGARWAVRGGFQRLGNSIRLTPQFVDTATRELVGATKIDGPIDDIFRLQDSIVTGLTDALHIQLSRADIARIGRDETAKLGAYEYYAKGRQHFLQFGESGIEQASRYYRQALEADPNYALAYAGLGSIHAVNYIARTRPEDLDAGIDLLERARSLDPDLAEPYYWLCYLYARTYRFAQALEAGGRGVALDPESGGVHWVVGLAHTVEAAVGGRWEAFAAAAAAYVRCLTRDPGHQTAHMNLASVFMLNGQYDAARATLDRALHFVRVRRLGPGTFVGALALRGVLHVREGELEAGREVLTRALDGYAASDHLWAPAFRAISHTALGHLALRTNAFDRALEHFLRAAEEVRAHPDGMGLGHLLVRAYVGQARAFHRLGMRAEARRQFEAASALLATRAGFDFNWIWEGGDAYSHYDVAGYQAAAGHRDEAIASLERAVASGWGDVPQLAADPAFASWGADPRQAAIRDAVAARGRIPDDLASLRVELSAERT